MSCGSTFIDAGFQKLAGERLEALERSGQMLVAPVTPITAAWDMMRTVDFQSNKSLLGSGRYRDEDIFRINVPGLPRDVTDTSLGVSGGAMEFYW